MIRALALAGLMVLTSAHAADKVNRFYGYAYDLETDEYLYTEVHEQKFLNDQWVSGSIKYYAPDGTLRGTKTMDFSADRFIPLYDYELPAQGYREGITKIGKDVLMTKTSGGKTKTASVPKKDPISGDSGFHNFILAHFDDLMAGKTVPFTFIAAGNLDTFKFRVKRVEDGSFEGKKHPRFLVEANSLLRLVAPDLNVIYDEKSRNLLEYRGPSNVLDPKTGDVYEARIAYYSQPPETAPKDLPPLQ